MEFSRNMRPAIPSPGDRHWSWSSRRESLGSGEEAGSTWGSAKGLFFFFALKYGIFSKGQRSFWMGSLLGTLWGSIPTHCLPRLCPL